MGRNGGDLSGGCHVGTVITMRGGSRLRYSLVAGCTALVAAACGVDGQQVADPAPTSTTTAVLRGEPAPEPPPMLVAGTDAGPPPAAAPDAAPAAPSTAARAPTAPPTTPTSPPRVRAVRQSGWSTFATVGGVSLTHPAGRIERVGFHESSHDGARQLDPAPTAIAPVTLESRQRGTAARTAADIVVDPAVEIRSPVTGRVKRAGRYVLYCKHSDDYVVVEPDARPGWEVKIIHIDGERVSPGDRVVAGRTVIAGRATQLPFESQVDDLRTADPAWPHVHIEVVDLAIPDRPTPGGGCP